MSHVFHMYQRKVFKECKIDARSSRLTLMKPVDGLKGAVESL